MAVTDPTAVRLRAPHDLPAAARLMREVHERDRYPVRWPADPTRFLDPPDALAAWIATDGRSLLGHVLLADAAPDAEVELAGSSDRPLALVSRLFVSRVCRGARARSTRTSSRCRGRHLG